MAPFALYFRRSRGPSADERERASLAAAFSSALRTLVRVALAPLVWLLTAVDFTVRRPSVVVTGAVLLICVPSRISDVSSSGHVTAADVAASAVVAIIAVRLLTTEGSITRHGWVPFAGALASFAIATLTATDVTTSVIGFIRYTEVFVLVPVAVAMSLRDRFDVLLVAAAVVAITLVEGVVGVNQYLTKTGASYAGQYVRAVGTFGPEQGLALGSLIGYGLIITLALGWAQTGRCRIVLVSGAAFLALPLALTLSRGAWIATAGAVVVLLVIASWRLASAVVGMAAVVVTIVVLGMGTGSNVSSSTVGQRLTSIMSSSSEPDQSVKDRYALWGTAVEIWRDHPVVGVGLKDFVQYRDSYAPVSLSAGSDVGNPTSGVSREPLLSPHNEYLMILSEQGSVGILAFGGLLATLTFGAFQRRSATRCATECRFLDLAAPAIMVWTLVDFAYGDIGAGPSTVLLAIMLGVAVRRTLIIPRPGFAADQEGP